MKKITYLLLLVAAVGAIQMGCSSRSNNVPTPSSSTVPSGKAKASANVMAAPPGIQTGLQGGRK
ncbi:MAG TPA: hypothetical protein VKV18_03375 [Chthonomonas sp.]|uniref:hypothetical protein n=1 Tax=Chthonomonas sp. TaxID=2282153 RepID=UPI002B4B36DE|nr:hypothetical protein [Chthonomonas sp.]HLI47719.1 hypothetical protein [Chthonomonas sp.]